MSSLNLKYYEKETGTQTLTVSLLHACYHIRKVRSMIHSHRLAVRCLQSVFVLCARQSQTAIAEASLAFSLRRFTPRQQARKFCSRFARQNNCDSKLSFASLRVHMFPHARSSGTCPPAVPLQADTRCLPDTLHLLPRSPDHRKHRLHSSAPY